MSKFVSFMDKAEAKFDSLDEKQTGVIVTVGLVMILVGIVMGFIGSIAGSDMALTIGVVTFFSAFITIFLIHTAFFVYNMFKA